MAVEAAKAVGGSDGGGGSEDGCFGYRISLGRLGLTLYEQPTVEVSCENELVGLNDCATKGGQVVFELHTLGLLMRLILT